MKTKITSLILPAALACCLTTSAFAQMQTIGVNVDGNDIFQIAMTSDGNGSWNINNEATRQLNGIVNVNGSQDLWTTETNRFINTSEAEITVKGIEYSEFPFITFSLDVTDIGAASSFGFSFSTPISLAAGPTEVSSSIGGSLTDGGSDGVTLTPDTVLLTSDVDGTNLGVDLGLLPATATAPAGGTGVFLFSEPTQAGPSLVSTSTLSADISFTLTGGDDLAAITGRVDVDPIPEPSTYAAIAGVLALGFVAYRRRK